MLKIFVLSILAANASLVTRAAPPGGECFPGIPWRRHTSRCPLFGGEAMSQLVFKLSLDSRQPQAYNDAKGIDQSSVCEAGYSVSNTTSTKMKNSNDTSASNISDNTSNSDVAPERIENSSDNTPDDAKHRTSGSSDPYQEKDSRSFTSPIPIGTLSSEEKEINEFLELQEKERVSNMARERNREKKICQGQQLVRKTSSSSDTQNAISTEINPIIEITHEHKTTKSESMPTDQAQNTGIKIPYNKRVEQVLRHDLSVFIKENINNK
ncbi:6248_t:CDS:2, partial [Diversispora eburnea]